MSSFIKFPLIVVALCAGFFADDIHEWVQEQRSPISLDDYCLMSTQACKQDDITVILDRDISQPLIATQMQVEWPSSEADYLLLTLEGYEMEMGTTVFKLTKGADDLYKGELMLPVCTLEAMTWVGELTDGNNTMKTSLRMER